MKVTAILKGNKDTHSKQTIYIRINEGKTRSFKATKMKASAGEWDAKKGRCKSNHSQAAHYNQVIKKLIVEAEAQQVNGFDLDYSDALFHKYCLMLIDSWERTKSPETLRHYRSEVNKLKAYTSDVKMSTVTHNFLEGYKQHLFSIGNQPNTVWKSLKFVRTIIRQAHREKVIRENPFDRFKMVAYKNPQKFFLTEHEVAAIEKYSLLETTKPHMRFVARWFVIGCFTGLRYGDMHKFDRKEHIKNGRLMLYTSKTGELVSIKFKDRLRELFERVDYKNLHLQNQPYNRELKEVQKDCKIRTKLTAHVSRHTFGVYCAEQGLSIETTGKLLGQKDLKVTAIYYKISNKRIDSEIDKLF